MKLWSLVLGSSFLFSGFQSSAPTPPMVPGYHLVFSDDFRNLDLSSDGKGAHTWYQGVWYAHSLPPQSNIQSTAQGLRLIWTRGQPAMDTSISTFSRNASKVTAWRYGYFEARMRWTPVRGAWPAFWLIPAKAGHVKESGELDIFEGQGAKTNEYYGTLHHWGEDANNPSRMVRLETTAKSNRFILPPDHDYSQWHTYGMLWGRDRIAWFLDGKKIHEEPAYTVFNNDDYCMIIGMQEGADWKEGNLDGVSANQMELDVDWVRVWQK